MLKKTAWWFFPLFLLLSCGIVKEFPNESDFEPIKFNPIHYVNPFIGTGGHGHTYPGATSPFGMVQLSPDTRLEGWDGCGGYHYSDSMIYGFSHTHLQGTGVPDYCDILFMPTNYHIKVADTWKDAYKSKFKHESERAHAGYYSVHLDDYNIQAELTTTTRTGIHHYTFAKGDSCRLFIDMMHRDELYYYDIGTEGDSVVWGYRVSKGWANEQHCYFYAVFSKPFKELTQLDISYPLTDSTGKKSTVFEQVQVFSLAFGKLDDLTVRVGISGTDVEGAKKNLYAEAPVPNFNHYVEKSAQEWETTLSKTPIAANDWNEYVKYYTALYHCYTVPNTWSDVDHRYRGMDNKIHVADGYTRYTVFSLWDTFRAYHPLMSTIEPEKTRDWIQTFLHIYQERGELPVWELAANETYCMIGYHSVPVIYDAYMRGVRDFDHQIALEAMIASATGPQDEKRRYEELGYVPSDEFSESVSKTLEFAYDDWCIAQFAQEIGDVKTYQRFIQRSQNWKNVFDPETKFMRPRRNGGFPTPFDPYQVDFNFTEANSWQYSFFVPHDIETLADYHGGEDQFYHDVEALFSAKNQTTGREQSDITGLIGQYAHGNEPSHHAAMLYRYGSAGVRGNQDKAREQNNKICNELYSNSPDGLCGNEDCGQMSAWYVLAKHGFYPLCPGNPTFLDLRSDENKNKPAMIGNHPVLAADRIVSRVNDYLIIPQPIIHGGQQSFRDSLTLHVTCADPTAKVELTIERNYEDPTTGDRLSTVTIDEFSKGWTNVLTSHGEEHLKFLVKAEASSTNGTSSKTSTAMFIHKDNHTQLIALSPYNNQYTGGGPDALVDGIRGGNDFRTGPWQAWQGRDVEMIVDLGSSRPITTIGLGCLQEIKSWIWFPSQIDIYLSDDGVNFRSAGYIKNEKPQDDYKPQTNDFVKNMRGVGRYIKLIAHPAFQTIPAWHLGVGGTPWIFADEIIIR